MGVVDLLAVIALSAVGVAPVVLLMALHPAVKPKPPRPPRLFTRITFCPVCHRIVAPGGCIHSAADVLAVFERRWS